MGETVKKVWKTVDFIYESPLKYWSLLMMTLKEKKSSKVKETKNQFIPARNVVLVK